MEIQLQSDNKALLQDTIRELQRDLTAPEFEHLLQSGPIEIEAVQDPVKGDPITLFTILVTAVGAGGALTVAMGKDGFLTRLVHVLEKLVERRITVKVKKDNGESVTLDGPAAHIRKLLRQK